MGSRSTSTTGRARRPISAGRWRSWASARTPRSTGPTCSPASGASCDWLIPTTAPRTWARQSAWPAAQAAYFQAYNLQPDNPDYAYNLAIGLEHLEQPKLALTYYRKALDLSFKKGHANFDQNRVIERVGQLAARVN